MLGANWLEGVLKDAARRQASSLEAWYPQQWRNAPAEQNFALHVAISLSATKGMALFGEANIGADDDPKERIDLVGYHPGESTLVAVEAKRYVEKGVLGLVGDVERISRFELYKHPRAMRPKTKWGVLVTSTIDRSHANWWAGEPDLAPRPGTGKAWQDLEAHLTKHATSDRGRRGAEDLKGRWLLWAFWLVRPQKT